MIPKSLFPIIGISVVLLIIFIILIIIFVQVSGRSRKPQPPRLKKELHKRASVLRNSCASAATRIPGG